MKITKAFNDWEKMTSYKELASFKNEETGVNGFLLSDALYNN